jgi:DNA-binding XRE family transcriptional regulator
MSINEKTGRVIRKARRAIEKSQVKLANDVGISLTSMLNIEKGKANPSWRTIVKIAKALGISLDSLK